VHETIEIGLYGLALRVLLIEFVSFDCKEIFRDFVGRTTVYLTLSKCLQN